MQQQGLSVLNVHDFAYCGPQSIPVHLLCTFLHLTKMTDALTPEGLEDVEGERSENKQMMPTCKEVMSCLCIIDD